MLLSEAKKEIDDRLELADDYKEHMPEYFEALEIASKCIEAQMRLADTLNDFSEQELDRDTYSARLCYDMLSSIRFDAKFDEDGMFVEEQDERA